MKDISAQIINNEFNYAQETSLQTQRDRLTLVNYNIIIFTAMISAGIGLENLILQRFLFGAFSIVTLIFILQIARLRQSWFSSAEVMNRIKEYGIKNDKSLKDALSWTSKTMPKPQNMRNISAMSVVLLSFLGGISIYLLCDTFIFDWYFCSLISVLYYVSLYLLYYIIMKFNI